MNSDRGVNLNTEIQKKRLEGGENLTNVRKISIKTYFARRESHGRES